MPETGVLSEEPLKACHRKSWYVETVSPTDWVSLFVLAHSQSDWPSLFWSTPGSTANPVACWISSTVRRPHAAEAALAPTDVALAPRSPAEALGAGARTPLGTASLPPGD